MYLLAQIFLLHNIISLMFSLRNTFLTTIYYILCSSKKFTKWKKHHDCSKYNILRKSNNISLYCQTSRTHENLVLNGVKFDLNKLISWSREKTKISSWEIKFVIVKTTTQINLEFIFPHLFCSLTISPPKFYWLNNSIHKRDVNYQIQNNL